MPRRRIVVGQSVDAAKKHAARDLRKRMTPEEAKLWEALRGGQLDGLRFRRQQVIDGFIVDFYCEVAGLVVEVDGEVHEGQQAYDADRDAVLARRRLRVLRIPNEDVRKDIGAVLDRIRRNLTP